MFRWESASCNRSAIVSMLPSGVFVKSELDDLVSSLPGRLIGTGPSRLTVVMEPEIREFDVVSVLELAQWSDEWCLIEIAGPEELTALVVQCLVEYEPAGEVLSCHYRSEAGEFSYALFREGKPMETFEVRGATMETVKFSSELRKVPLQNLLKASDFMIESLGILGINSDPGHVGNARKIRMQVNLPGKRTLWQMILGATSSR